MFNLVRNWRWYFQDEDNISHLKLRQSSKAGRQDFSATKLQYTRLSEQAPRGHFYL